ncbi:hypothetical protein FRB97_005590 [Tulasnella sp. 331]|nr:hypothetical protein FRB97_005590 [Tulasnella sp. 331]KAG8889235.1 hypothetical protein FRB98_005247 [Tulasnella sp. 332]
MKIVPGGVEAQMARTLKNLKTILEPAGSSLNTVLNTTVLLKDMEDLATVDRVYSGAFGDHKPARSVVEFSRLPMDILVGIECVALTE